MSRDVIEEMFSFHQVKVRLDIPGSMGEQYEVTLIKGEQRSECGGPGRQTKALRCYSQDSRGPLRNCKQLDLSVL